MATCVDIRLNHPNLHRTWLKTCACGKRLKLRFLHGTINKKSIPTKGKKGNDDFFSTWGILKKAQSNISPKTSTQESLLSISFHIHSML